ncbi:MAG: O-antigen ligase family protein [Acidimicrobiia bacterium]|nr:O-antigen ligase family protein [Acidimicrobiia bacterium]
MPIPSRPRRSATGRRLDHNVSLLTGVLGFVVAGYLLFDRAFAWIHIPGTPIFVGEVALAAGFFVVLQTPQLGRLIRVSRPIQFLLLFMLWGLALAFQGFGNWGIDAVRDSALWYYGGFALISAALLLYKPDLWEQTTDRLVRFIPFLLTLLIVRLVFAQTAIGPRIPDSQIRLTAHKPANIAVNVAIVLALLLIVAGPSVSRELRGRARIFTLLGLLLVVAVGTQSRGGFVAAFMVLAVVFYVARHVRGLIIGVVGLAVLVAVLAAALDVKIQLERRELSVEQVLENIKSITEEASAGGRYDNTTQWRLALWKLVSKDVLQTERVLAGFGFGENLALRFDFESESESVPLRNPHNSHLSVLARMGTVGMALWIAMFATWYMGLIRARRQFLELGEDRRANLALWLMLGVSGILINAFFDPTLEGPQVGIILWLLFGAGATLGIGARSLGGRRRGRHSPRVVEWLLHETVAPISSAHPSQHLSPDPLEVVTGFDELLEETGDASDPE